MSGCTNSGENQSTITSSFYGTWKDRDTWYRSYTFYENKTCIINGNLVGTYNITEEELTILFPSGELNIFQYYINDFAHTLQLTNVQDGYIRVFEKQ